jgi:hypothetical protein
VALTHILLFFLVLGAFCFSSGAAVVGALQLDSTGRERPSEAHSFLRPALLGEALIGIGGLLTLGFGIALAQHQGIGFSAGWIQAALGLWVASMALGLYGGRMASHTRSLTRRPTEEGDAPTGQLGSLVGVRPPLLTSWASGLLLLAILGLAVWQPTGSATPSYASSTVVPLHVQHAITRKFPQFFAYLPTRLPHGLHYTSYDSVRGFEFSMWFSSRNGSTAALEYSVVAAECATQASAMRSFTVNGVDVSWSGDYTNQRAWRCVMRGRTSLVVSASRSVEGDANPFEPGKPTPKQHRDALDLAQVVAYAEPIR